MAVDVAGPEVGGQPTALDDRPSPLDSQRLSRLVTSYLNAPADEVLALVLEELNRETARRLGETVERAQAALAGEIAEVREDIRSAQRESSRLGRELVRSGATLDSIQSAVAAVGPTLEEALVSLRTELVRQQGRERQLREEAEQAALNDMLATLDGLELGLQVGQDLVPTLAEAHRRLEDPVLQRWWRAIGEISGVECPLPTVPLDDVGSWLEGLRLTYRRLQDAVARRGVIAIEAVGQPFDPYLHEAVAVEPCPVGQDGLVLREQRRGYHTADRVVRLAQVVVGRGTSNED